MVGILGGVDAGLLKRGRESHKYFARNGRLFGRNPVRRMARMSDSDKSLDLRALIGFFFLG